MATIRRVSTAPDRSASDAPALLVAAARELLGETTPADVTVRTIAGRAGLQHSLITRYFGSRDALLGVAVGEILAEVGQAMADAADLDGAVATGLDRFRASPGLTRAVGTLVTQGVTPTDARFPIVEALDAHLRAAGADPVRARDTAVAVIVVVFGWSAAEPWWSRMTLTPDDGDAAREVLEQAVRTLIDAALAPPETADR